MKKFIALLLALMMVLGTCLAEGEQAVYCHGTLGFSFSHPAEWELDSETETGCFMLGHDGMMAIAVEATDIGEEVSYEDFLTIYVPMLISNFAAQYPGMETLLAGEMVTVGDQEYVQQALSVEIEGKPRTMVLNYKLAGTYMYVIGFTVEDSFSETNHDLISEETDLMLSTFLTGGAAAVEEEPAAEETPANEEAVTEEMPAADAGGALVYANTRGGYSFAYPSDMLLMSKDNVQDMLDKMTSGDYSMEGMDATALQQNADQIRQTDMTMVMYGTGVFNYNIVYQNAGVALTNDLVLSALCPSFINQYKAIYPELVMVDEGSVYTMGDKEYITQALQVKAGGYDMTIVILYAVNGTYLYNITFTVADMVMDDDFTAYVNSAVELFASSFEMFEPAAE